MGPGEGLRWAPHGGDRYTATQRLAVIQRLAVLAVVGVGVVVVWEGEAGGDGAGRGLGPRQHRQTLTPRTSKQRQDSQHHWREKTVIA